MKFYSKLNNYRILLTPNIPGNPYMQIPPVYGKSVKFTGGVADVDDEEVIELMKSHKQFGRDFFAGEDDPFKAKRADSEPVHDTTEIVNGRPGKSVSSNHPIPGQEKIEEMVKEMAIKLLAEGGYVKEEVLPVNVPKPVYVDDEPMDTALSDAGELPEDAPRERVVPPAIETDNQPPEDDGINPLASTSQDGGDDSSEEKSSVENRTKPKKSKK